MNNGIVYCGFTVSLPLAPVETLKQTLVLQRCETDQDYEDGLRKIWASRDDIVILEHDIKAGPAQIEELLACPVPLCAFAYPLYPATTGLKEPVIAHLRRVGTEYVWIQEGDQWAEHGALGLTKLGRLARREVPTWQRMEGDVLGTWRNLDTRISRAMNDAGLKYHIHWPVVEHEHKESKCEPV